MESLAIGQTQEASSMHLLFMNKLTVKILCVCSLHGRGKSYLSQFAADQASVPARGLSVMWSIFQRYQKFKKDI